MRMGQDEDTTKPALVGKTAVVWLLLDGLFGLAAVDVVSMLTVQAIRWATGRPAVGPQPSAAGMTPSKRVRSREPASRPRRRRCGSAVVGARSTPAPGGSRYSQAVAKTVLAGRFEPTKDTRGDRLGDQRAFERVAFEAVSEPGSERDEDLIRRVERATPRPSMRSSSVIKGASTLSAYECWVMRTSHTTSHRTPS